MVISKTRLHELLRFATVGIISTLVHGGVLMAMVESDILAATYANLCAFTVAFLTSYLGHYHWTYKADQPHLPTATKFVVTAIGGLLLNYLIFLVMVDILELHYLWAFGLVVTVIPSLTYVMHKGWAFK